MHILLIEDDESLRRGVSLKLTKEGYRVDTAGTIAEAKTLFEAERFNLVICDVGLPDGSGFDFCQHVRQSSDVLFLFLTARDEEIDMVQGYEAGADDYVTKPFSLMVLIAKVGAMLGRVRQSESGVIRSGDITLYPVEKRAEKSGVAISLTNNEWQLLSLFMQHPRHILSKRQLLDALWDADSDYADDNTVAVNIRRLRERIEDDPSAPRYIKNIRGMGYSWDVEGVKE